MDADDETSAATSSPRRMNAQVVILERVDGVWYTLLQLRCADKVVAPRHLSSIGGCWEEGDEDAEHTATRELLEESGVVPDRLREFARSPRCVWFWARQLTRVPPTTPHEVDDTRVLRRRLGGAHPRALGAPYGHLWVQADRVAELRWPCMTAVRERVAAALAAAEAERLAAAAG